MVLLKEMSVEIDYSLFYKTLVACKLASIYFLIQDLRASCRSKYNGKMGGTQLIQESLKRLHNQLILYKITCISFSI